MNKLSPTLKFGCSSCSKLAAEFDEMFNKKSNVKININPNKITNVIGRKMTLKSSSKLTSLF